MDMFLLYAFTRLDVINVICGVLTAALLIVPFGRMLLIDCEYNLSKEEKKAEYIKLRRYWWWAAIPTLLMVIIPTQKDAAIILAGHGIYEAAHSEAANRLASKSVQLIEKTLDKYLDKAEVK